jgi:hypothetical protein
MDRLARPTPVIRNRSLGALPTNFQIVTQHPRNVLHFLTRHQHQAGECGRDASPVLVTAVIEDAVTNRL